MEKRVIVWRTGRGKGERMGWMSRKGMKWIGNTNLMEEGCQGDWVDEIGRWDVVAVEGVVETGILGYDEKIAVLFG